MSADRSFIAVGIDVGGTFTDLYALPADGADPLMLKVPTTPHDFVQGVLAALEAGAIDLQSVSYLILGSTVATNAVIERKFPPVAFITTEGFRDLISIGRYHREKLYDPYQRKPPPLVPRRHRFTVEERIDAEGRVLRPLNSTQTREVAEKIRQAGVRAVAVGLLNSYRNAAHEDAVAAIVRDALPDSYVTTSAAVCPKVRPLGRFITTIVRAALHPLLASQVTRLQHELKARGFTGTFSIVQSNGGMTSTSQVTERPEHVFVSGPAAGVEAAVVLCQQLGETQAITMDMGGTSCDVALIEHGRAAVTTSYEIDWDMPLLVPMIDVNTVGAGGGSIAWIDSGGILKVGPQSAGADPGPACYGKGGTQATVTDANLLLGYLSPQTALAGIVHLQIEPARAAVAQLANTLGLDLMATAQGIIRIVNANMANAIREVSIDRGRDPRDFVLIAYGGAGPMHAVAVAQSLGIPRVIVPFAPGVFSASGATVMDVRHDCEGTCYMPLQNADVDELNRRFALLEDQGQALLAAEGFSTEQVKVERTAEMRYVGQTYEVTTSVPAGRKLNREDLALIAETFHREHERLYGVSDPQAATAIVDLRVRVVGSVPKPSPAHALLSERSPAAAITEHRQVYVPEIGAFRMTTVYDRARLRPGNSIAGPAVIEQHDATTVIPPETTATVDTLKNLIITVREV